MDPSVRRQAPATRPDPEPMVASAEHAPHHRRAGTGARRAVSVNWLVLVFGVWLMTSAFLWDRGTVAGFDGGWIDFLAGTAVAGIAVARIVAPLRTVPLGLVTVLAGLWLIAAPYVLGYSGDSDAAIATLNSRAVGVTIALLAMFGVLSASKDRGVH
jgi:hypothetical protein